MLNNGDKLVVIKKVAPFLNEGDVVKVVNVTEDGIISFAFGEGFMHMGMMNSTECENHFEKLEEKPEIPTITEDWVAEIMENSEFDIYTAFDKCTVVSCKLPNGFVITESSACVDPKNYDAELEEEICLDKIANKIWELEAYRLQCELYNRNCCDRCPYEEECGCDDECDECLDTDLDCDDCYDYDCPYNYNK